jgi:hypothetical protein
MMNSTYGIKYGAHDKVRCCVFILRVFLFLGLANFLACTITDTPVALADVLEYSFVEVVLSSCLCKVLLGSKFLTPNRRQ